MKKQNQCHPSIKFEYEISKTEINFLDTTVFKVDNKPRTKVYAKPTDRQTNTDTPSDKHTREKERERERERERWIYLRIIIIAQFLHFWHSFK